MAFTKHKKSSSELTPLKPKENEKEKDEYYQKLQQSQDYFVFNNYEIL
jgi:hypothetical protein